MAVRYWIGVVGLAHARLGEQEGFCAFSHGKKSPIEKLSDGDRFAYYAPKTGFPTGDPVQKFVALGTVIDSTPFQTSWVPRSSPCPVAGGSPRPTSARRWTRFAAPWLKPT